VYDNENRLTDVKLPAGTLSTYTYAGDGLHRSAFEAGGSLTTMIWDGTDYLMEKS
jgi:YD repeat-containing protein